MKTISKILKLVPETSSNGEVTIGYYVVKEEKWETSEINIDSQEKVIDKLIETAAKHLILERDPYTTTLVEVETTGLKVIQSEGGVGENTLTYLSLEPLYLKKILFIKCSEDNTCRVVYEYRPKFQAIIYDGFIEAKNIDYSFIIVETEKYSRIIFPHELVLPRLRLRKAKKTKRTRKNKTSKSK